MDAGGGAMAHYSPAKLTPMSDVPAQPDDTSLRISEVVRRYWGYDTLRPLQEEAIRASVERRDSLVVMPTGGGKSLCYQVPPEVAGRTDIVISPLIALMKDQVDGLREVGYPAAALYGNVSYQERAEIETGLRDGAIRLLFAAPERILQPSFLNMIQSAGVSSFAIDEAHCISQWGHDFRPEYRQLATLRQRFPQASFHAFTATATPRVQQDIVHQLQLREPLQLIGQFDRPNLVYRILPKVDEYKQVAEVVQRHRGEAVIVYCISRNDTEQMAAVLKANGIKAAHYHAGLEPNRRRQTQDDFTQEKIDVVVATVAFGMGIDRSDVRCVIHAALPKTIEGYQQETGRAGRDGMEAECVMLYSGGDAIRWENLIDRSAENAENPAQVTAAQRQLLKAMQRFSNTPQCRHRALTEYFGQSYEKPNCGACDVCLEDVEGYEDGTVTAQKILSCVARVQQKFGIGHVVDVLTGANTEMIRRCSHDQLSTYGLLKETARDQLQAMVYQLVDQGLLVRTPGDRPVLQLNDLSWQVMKGQCEVRLLRPKLKRVGKTRKGEQSWEGVHKELFEHLRQWRRRLAEERGVPPYVIFADTTLMELARVRPTKAPHLRSIAGIGDKRLADLGESVMAAVRGFCEANHVETDVMAQARVIVPVASKTNPAKDTAFQMFRQARSVAEVSQAIARAPSTTTGYLEEFIIAHRPQAVSAWVDDATYQRVREAMGDEQRLKPIFDKLDGQVPFEIIRLVSAHQKAMFEQSLETR
jgi:ATP-dependent DNA helicase RecQ